MVGFPRAARLRSGIDFKRALQARKKASGRWFTASATVNELGRARLGIVIGRRMLPQAARRNRIRRVTRERFRHRAVALGPVDIVVRLRTALRSQDMSVAEAEIDKLLEQLTQ